MTRILAFLLVVLALPACSTLPEGVAYEPASAGTWHRYVDGLRAFTIDSPGRLQIRPAAIPARDEWQRSTYTLNAGTLRFSVTAIERHRGDRRSVNELVYRGGMALEDWTPISVPGAIKAYEKDYYTGARLQRHRIIFTHRMIYELHVAGPTDVYPNFSATRFFRSFSMLSKT
jgi:hypothetical protein